MQNRQLTTTFFAALYFSLLLTPSSTWGQGLPESYTSSRVIYGPETFSPEVGNATRHLHQFSTTLPELPHLLVIEIKQEAGSRLRSPSSFQIKINGRIVRSYSEFHSSIHFSSLKSLIEPRHNNALEISFPPHISNFTVTIKIVRKEPRVLLELVAPGNQYTPIESLLLRLSFNGDIQIEDSGRYIILDNPNRGAAPPCLSWSPFTVPDVCRAQDETVVKLGWPIDYIEPILNSRFTRTGRGVLDYYPSFEGGPGPIPSLVLFADNGFATLLGGAPNLSRFLGPQYHLDLWDQQEGTSVYIGGLTQILRHGSIISPYVEVDQCTGKWLEIPETQRCPEGYIHTNSDDSWNTNKLCCTGQPIMRFRQTDVIDKKTKVKLHAFVANIPPQGTAPNSIDDLNGDGIIDAQEATSQFELLSNVVTLETDIYLSGSMAFPSDRRHDSYQNRYWHQVKDLDGNGKTGYIPWPDAPAPPIRLYPRIPPR